MPHRFGRRSPRFVVVTGFAVGVGLVASCSTGAGVRVERADTAAAVTTPPTTLPGPPDSAPDPSDPSSGGVGDELFPDLGNAGIDVTHYDLDLRYDPVADHIDATVTIDIGLTATLDEIRLDSDGPAVSQATVDGTAADFRVADGDLVVTLPQPLDKGTETRVQVAYALDPRGGVGSIGLPSGWFNTPGGSYVLNEPDGAHSWLPCNDHPSDKATYTFHLHVPAGATAVANGALVSHTNDAAGETWVWEQSQPMATYLVQLLTGDYELVEGTGPHGLPLVSAVLRDDVTAMQPFLDVTGEQVAFFEQWFGPYPLDRYGLAISDSSPGLAMETQGRSLFSRDDFSSGELDSMAHLLLSHELTHQWFGDAVSPARWRDIWLNESFATYGQWMWLEHVDMGTVEESATMALAGRPPGSSADPIADDLFGYNSYDGGAVVLHALRRTIGDDDFFTVLRRWVAENIGESRTTDDFIATAEAVTGEDLTEFFDTWLFADVPPDHFP